MANASNGNKLMPTQITDPQKTTAKTNTLIDNFTFELADSKLTLDRKIADGIKANRLFYDGDHYQDGNGWIGPRPSADNPQAADIQSRFEAGFVSKNMVKECVNREVNAIIGKQPDWVITVKRAINKVPAQIQDPAFPDDPSKKIDDPNGLMVDEPLKADEQKLIDEANAIVIPWWDMRQVLKAIQTAARQRSNLGQGALRPFVPEDELTADGKMPKLSIDKAIMLVHVDNPEPEDSTIFVRKSSMREVSIVRINDEESQGQKRTWFEVSALTADNKTVIGVLTKDGDKTDGDTLTTQEQTNEEALASTSPEGNQFSDPLALGGRLLLHVMKGDPLITPQVRQNQKLLNLALTMCGLNLNEGGFPERSIANAELDGTYIPDPTVEGGKRFVPNPLPRGFGVSLNLQGATYEDKDGNEHVLEPRVSYKDPVEVATFVTSKELARDSIYEEVHQMHALMSADASAAGVSRIQALADFVMNSLPIKEAVDSGGKYIIETALAWAAVLAGAPNKFDSLRVNFDCKIDTGPLTPEERTALQGEVDKKLRSRKSYMLLAGQQDPEAELVQIRNEGDIFPPPAPKPTSDPVPPAAN